VIALLAKNGAATLSSERSRAPLDRVGSPTGLEFTREQVTSMVMGAADGDGIRGSALDAADAVPKNKRVPPVSYLLAAWVATAASSGAAAVRRLMGPQD
jgi:hypothetical protein